jgi:general secretion pathway protein G
MTIPRRTRDWLQRGRRVFNSVSNSIPNSDAESNSQSNFQSNYQITRLPNYQIGFTLIELLIVLALISILAGIGMAQYKNSVVFAKESVLKQDLFRMRDAIDQYYADKNQYPSTLDALVSDGYMRKIPEDPFTKSTTSWQTVPAEPDPNNPTAEAGVYDVKSGSELTALDGTRYAEW